MAVKQRLDPRLREDDDGEEITGDIERREGWAKWNKDTVCFSLNSTENEGSVRAAKTK